MKQQLKCCTIFLIVIFFSNCLNCNKNLLRKKIRGDYKDVLNLKDGPLISSRKTNNFFGGFYNSCFLRDQVHYIIGGQGYTECAYLASITIDLRQTYELNTLIVWLWDRDLRVYNFIIYALYNGVETIIFDSLASTGVIRVSFKAQLVTQFRIYNRHGNTSNSFFHIIKAEAFYQL